MKIFFHLIVCILLSCNLAGSEKLSSDVSRVLDELKSIVNRLETENHKQADVTKGVNANDGTTIADELELEANMRDLIEKDKRQSINNAGTMENTIKDEGLKSADELDITEDLNNAIEMDKKVTCKDFNHDKCYQHWKANDCSKKDIRKICPRACQTCCADYYPLSFCLARKRYCHKAKRMENFCPKTCEFCGKAHTLPYCVGTPFGCCWDRSTPAAAPIGSGAEKCPPCKDKQSNKFCKRLSSFCNDFNPNHVAGRQMRALCPKTCRVCGANRICRDDPRQKDKCLYYKEDGLCEANKNPMRYWCSKTCGFC